MKFWSDGEVEVWVAERGLPQVEDRPLRTMLYHDVPVAHRRIPYNYRQPQTAPALAAELVKVLGVWDESVLWVTEWGIWPSSEDWPAYYAARGIHGERRSIDDAPGHWFEAVERDVLAEFITLVLRSGWDAFVLTAANGRLSSTRLHISHDEWVEVQSAAGARSGVTAG